MVLKAPRVSPPSLSHQTLNNRKHSFILVYERLDSESPQQKPLDGEVLASMQT
jgi:hypothetical protein